MEGHPGEKSANGFCFNKTYTILNSHTVRPSAEPCDNVMVIPDTPSPVFSRLAGRKDRSSQQTTTVNGVKRKLHKPSKDLVEYHTTDSGTGNHQKRIFDRNKSGALYFDNDSLNSNSDRSLKCKKIRLKNNKTFTNNYFFDHSKSSSQCSEGEDLNRKPTSQNCEEKSWGFNKTPISNNFLNGVSRDPSSCGKQNSEQSPPASHGIQDHLQARSDCGSEIDRCNKEIFNDWKSKNKPSSGVVCNSSEGIDSSDACRSLPTDGRKARRMGTLKDLNKYFEGSDSSSSEEQTGVSLSKYGRHSSKISSNQPSQQKFKFDTLRWPSDSESGSENDDSVPLKKLLDNASEKKRKLNSQGNNDASQTSANVSFADEIGAMDTFPVKSPKKKLTHNCQHVKKSEKNKYFDSPLLSRKSALLSQQNDTEPQGVPTVRRSNDGRELRQDSVPRKTLQKLNHSHSKLTTGSSESIQCSSKKTTDSDKKQTPLDSFKRKVPDSKTSKEVQGPSQISNDDDDSVIFVSSSNPPEVNNEAIYFNDSMDIEFDQDIGSTDSVSSSFRAPFISPRVPIPNSVRRGRLGERRTRPERPEEVAVIDNIQIPVSPRDLLSPYAMGRSRTSRSNKGRLSRVRNMSRERVSTHGTDFTTAASLLSPQARDAVQQVNQQQSDEDYARRLQEEMDMEFALSLHNMENQPPPAYPTGGATADSRSQSHEVSDSDRSQQSTGRMFGLEDIEAYLNNPGNSPGTLDMLRASMVTSPPRIRSRTRATRRQRLNNSVEALNRMEAHLMSIIDRSNAVVNRNRRGRRFFPAVPSVGDGQDYEELLNLAEIMGEVKKRGLSEHQVTKLPERKYQTIPGEDTKECHICMSEFVDMEILRILPCFHEFHTPCIDKWIVENATCPVCREEVLV